jgi:hypothetical protein
VGGRVRRCACGTAGWFLGGVFVWGGGRGCVDGWVVAIEFLYSIYMVFWFLKERTRAVGKEI